MSRRRKARPGIARVEIEGVEDRHDRRIGNAERFVIAMNPDRSAVITVDADTPEMAEALAVDFWKSNQLRGRPKPTIIRRDELPQPTADAWKLSDLQDEIERADKISAEAKAARNELIRRAKHIGPTDIAAITGLTKGRIPQIRS